MMGKSVFIKRMTAGIIGSALILGYAGTVLPEPIPVLAAESGKMTSYFYNEQSGMYEYEFLDAYVNDVDVNSGNISIEIIPSTGGNVYNYSNSKKIIFPSKGSSYGELAVLYESSNFNLAAQIEEKSRINITLASTKEYEDMVNTFSYTRGREYYFSYIVDVKDPDVHIFGDINEDGVVDPFDIITYQKYIAGTLSEELSEDRFLNADINMDTEITADDMKQVRDFVLGSTKEFNGASNIGSVRLDNTVTVQAAEGTQTDEAFAKAEMKFGVDLLKKCYAERNTDNVLLSPLSISSALSMTANGADGETRAEMEKVLGDDLTIDDINEYMAYYISDLPDEEKEKVYLADSVWFRDAPVLKVQEEFLETNKKFYNAEIYKSPFDSSTVKDVNSWVNKNTKGMIPSLISDKNIKQNSMMMLINTLYFESEWRSPYYSTYKGEFTDLEGNKHTIDEMNSMEYQYFDLGNADAFKKPYINEDYSFVGILPHEDVPFDSFVEGLDGKTLVDGLKEYEDPDTLDLYVMIPKFKYNYEKSLSDILPMLGMEKAFDPALADFSRMNDMSVEGAAPLYIDDVLHKTKIEVTEKGTKASAATAVVMGAGASAPVEKKKVYIYLDRPFVYMIVDKNNVPLFIGAVTRL
ncbi:MAG: hypothetical protein IKH96_02605 [Ruminococcus sp.]|nr:hypothetical protein [Ruminococcus sp.]